MLAELFPFCPPSPPQSKLAQGEIETEIYPVHRDCSFPTQCSRTIDLGSLLGSTSDFLYADG